MERGGVRRAGVQWLLDGRPATARCADEDRRRDRAILVHRHRPQALRPGDHARRGGTTGAIRSAGGRAIEVPRRPLLAVGIHADRGHRPCRHGHRAARLHVLGRVLPPRARPADHPGAQRPWLAALRHELAGRNHPEPGHRLRDLRLPRCATGVPALAGLLQLLVCLHLRRRRPGRAVQDRRLRLERPVGVLVGRSPVRHVLPGDDVAVVGQHSQARSDLPEDSPAAPTRVQPA